MTDKISTEEDDWGSPPDTCFQCLVSPTAAEARGYQRAIDTLRDEAAFWTFLDNQSAVDRGGKEANDRAADFLESRKAES